MRCNKKVLMIATTAMLGVGCIGLMGAMKYQNVKTEASDMKESDVAKAGIDVSSQSMEGETPIEDEDKLDKEVVETYSYKGYEVSFIRYKDPKTGEYVSDKEQDGDYGYKKTFREIIDNAEKSGWNYMLEEVKGKKGQITAEIDWKRDEDQIVNGKYYGKLIRECSIFFKAQNLSNNDMDIQLETFADFSTVAETGKYLQVGKSSSSDLVEYPNQWKIVTKEQKNKVMDAFDKFENIKFDKSYKKEVKEYLKQYKDDILKELKDVYGINVVKEVTDKQYEKQGSLAMNDIYSGSVRFFGKTDEDKNIEVCYDLCGNYITSFQYNH